MSENFREESRKNWSREAQATMDDIKVGCLQRIADACELTAKRHQELIAANERLERSLKYHRDEAERLARRLNAMKGLVTKLKQKAVTA